MRTKILGNVIGCAVASYAAIGVAETATQEYSLDIPNKPVAAMLQDLSIQTGISVSLIVDDVDHRNVLVGPLKGRYTVDAALSELLADSDLTFTRVNGDMVVVTARNSHGASGAATSAEAKAKLHRLAQMQFVNVAAEPGTAPSVAAPLEPASAEADTRRSGVGKVMEEVFVTAQKRSERLQDVPVPVTAVSSNTLVNTNQLRLQDYFARVPGLNFQAGSRAEPLVSIRGINSLQNPTVGVMIDDVPYGSTVFRGGGNIAPDIDPGDLERVEVLRGPQGTLYGVSSLGGLIKYVTIDPSTDALKGSVQTGVTSIEGGHEMGYSVRAAINLPINDVFAVRASGFTRSDPGYIDNVTTGQRDVNSSDGSGGLLSALLKPSDALFVKLSALYQERNFDGANQVTSGLGDLEQNYLRGSGWIERTNQAYSATVRATMGSAELTSLTGYSVNRFHDSVDLSSLYGTIANTNFGVRGVPYVEDYEAKKFTQEVRLMTPLGERFDLLLGAFYTNEDYTAPIEVQAADPATGAQVGTLQIFDGEGGYEEYAAFGDLTVHFTDRFDVQVGARQSRNTQTYREVDTGVPQLVPGGVLIIPESEITEKPFTYLFTPRFKFSQDLMTYARFASGYRAGGINLYAARGFPVPPGYDSDKTQSYEVGLKGNLFDRMIAVDASVFYIDWKDLQLGFRFAPGVNYQDNASRAKSQGIELAIDARPLDGFSVSLSATYNDAVLKEGFGSSTTFGRPGDRLPFSSRFAGSLSLDQEIPLANDLVGFVGASVNYVGDRVGLFQSTARRQLYPSYTQIDFRAGLELDTWRANVFVTNVDDERGLIGGGIGQTVPTLFTYIQPRTYGLSLSKSF